MSKEAFAAVESDNSPSEQLETGSVKLVRAETYTGSEEARGRDGYEYVVGPIAHAQNEVKSEIIEVEATVVSRGDEEDAAKAAAAGKTYESGVKEAADEFTKEAELVIAPPPVIPKEYQSKSFFSRMADGVAGFAEKVYKNSVESVVERIRIAATDKLGVGFNTMLMKWHQGEVNTFAGDIQSAEERIVEIQNAIKKQHELEEAGRAHFGTLSPDDEARFRQETDTLQSELVRTIKYRDESNVLLQQSNEKLLQYELKRDLVLSGLTERLNGRLAEYETARQERYDKIGQIDVEIKSFIVELVRARDMYNEMDGDANKAGIYTGSMKELGKKIKEIEFQIKKREQEREEYKKRFEDFDFLAKKYRTTAESYSLSELFKPEYKTPELSEVAIESEDEAEVLEQPLSPEQVLRQPQEFIQKWNSILGSRLTISEKDFLLPGIELPAEGINLVDFQNLVEGYWVRQKQAGKTNLSQRNLRRAFYSLKNTL